MWVSSFSYATKFGIQAPASTLLAGAISENESTLELQGCFHFQAERHTARTHFPQNKRLSLQKRRLHQTGVAAFFVIYTTAEKREIHPVALRKRAAK